ncbi:MAG TPA: sigma-70 family RNA polymerase sigma factor [Anaerolineales bacterium]|nr:sigma-70 family RNA polymerase sigma factor [Anaerolineales bacterium]
MKTLASKEQELLRLASQLDAEALADIYDRYSTGLYTYATRLLNDATLAEDCVAEVFARFLKSLQKGQGPRDHLRAYLYRITHNWIVDYYRDHQQVSELTETLHETLPSEEFPEEEAAKRVRQKQLREAIRHLTPNQQKVIALKYLEDWSNEEVAQALHKTVGAIKSIQHHALVSLQRLLMEDTDEQ